MGVSRPAWSRAVGPVLYGALFVVALPAGLVLWARALDAHLALPIVHAPLAGGLVAVAGFAVWAAGVIEIVRRGDGLPMNAFPPVRYVSSGIYALVAHPIYAGWTMACAGVSVGAGSAAGFWIVTPAVAMGCVALVLGYERHDLRRRFGKPAIVRPWLSLPPDADTPPRWSERIAIWGLALATWIVVSEWQWTRPVDISAYVVIPLAALLAPTRAGLRRYAIQGLVAGVGLALARSVVPASGAWSGFHLMWAAFAADAIAARSRSWSLAAWLGVAGLAASGIVTGTQTMAGVSSAVIVWIPLRRPMASWRLVLDGTERLANSWQAWRIGPARVISHGVFAGLAAAVGVFVIGTLAGAASLAGIVVLAVSTLVGAGLWAQLVEGSPALLRPFGYYGGIIGGLIGAAIVATMGEPIGVMLGATAAAAPWVQALGRLRCLVQGCCHGGVTDPRLGIRVTNAHSRVVTLAHLDGQPIHATQLYSIVGNVVLGLGLLGAWIAGTPVWFIAGAYLIGAGLARFVEEGFRAEPQTITWRGLPIYQYLAVASVLVGVAFTTWGGVAAPSQAAAIDARVVIASLVIGAAYWFAMGVDFPESSRRFARLSG